MNNKKILDAFEGWLNKTISFKEGNVELKEEKEIEMAASGDTVTSGTTETELVKDEIVTSGDTVTEKVETELAEYNEEQLAAIEAFVTMFQLDKDNLMKFLKPDDEVIKAVKESEITLSDETINKKVDERVNEIKNELKAQFEIKLSEFISQSGSNSIVQAPIVNETKVEPLTRKDLLKQRILNK